MAGQVTASPRTSESKLGRRWAGNCRASGPRLHEALGGPLAQQNPEERPSFIALVCPQEGRGGSRDESPSLQWELTHVSTSEGHHLPNVTFPARPALPVHSEGQRLPQGLTRKDPW